ncbi:extracellular serine-rich protein [Stemphylium lycopersici]|uniref:Extracellular serine-rich protein n=1 Tax=Stemphylium lycopersici TaxID=183478 RepID=A0A364N0Z3_STELY|nr:extracellular serine-rich protein [Stemphylium lycopersici]RAR08903.1 extracellular serine-rich protein [Stemphylium lycopersici]
MKPTWLGIAAVRLLSTPVLAQVASVVSSVTSEVSPITTDSSTQTASGSTASSTPTASNEPKVHLIKAGAGGFKFTPQEIHNVSVGDIVSWEFYPPDHSVARAEYGSACVPYEYTGIDKVGFWSETQWVNDTSQITYFNITINSTEPIFFYCAAPESCTGKLMVGAINPNSTQTLASQVHAAAVADFQVAPGEPIPAEASSTLSSAPTSIGPPGGSGGDDGDHSLSTGAIAGIVVGGVAFLAICAALFFFVGRSKTLKETIKRQDAANNPDPHMS